MGSIPISAALRRMSCSLCSRPGSPLTITARRRRRGTSSCSSCNRFAISSEELSEKPVTLPPGCARLWATPRATGSSTPTRTMGTAALARFAASVAGVPTVTRTATPEPISFSMMPGSCSVRSPAERSRIAMLLPSVQPSAERSPRNASRRLWFSCRDPTWTKPMRGIVTWAKAGLQAIAVAAASSINSRRFTR